MTFDANCAKRAQISCADDSGPSRAFFAHFRARGRALSRAFARLARFARFARRVSRAFSRARFWTVIAGKKNRNHGPRASLLASIIAYVVGWGGGRAIIARLHQGSRVSLLAFWGWGGPAIIAHAHHFSRVSLPAYWVGGWVGGGGGITARVYRSSRVSLLAHLGGGGTGNYSLRASLLACIIARILGVGGPDNHRSRASKIARIIARIFA